MTKRDKAPPPICILTQRGLSPATAYDAEELARHAPGTEFDMVARTKRSNPQQGTYWKALTRAVEATGRWESRDALHTALKIELGYVEPIFNLKGKVVGMKPDSTAFNAMPHKDFCEYMDKAMAALSEAIGYDALEWMNA
ncbi:hypothetical protein [Yoonia sp.]|uniref:hypothetical protein n=1 Tax=Yoonia sp. TaxID=2212373 RepID=UPI002E09AAB8|nr:hypothetical protein [Yoonia sp.]